MDLSATDVENREFTEGRRGYVREEVDRFLDDVASQFRRYDERLTGMAQRIAALEGDLAQSRGSEEVTRRMLMVAQKAAEEAVAEAEEKARAMVEGAEKRAAALEEDTKRRRAALESDIEALRRFEAEYRAQVKQGLEAHLALLQRTGRTAAEVSRGAPGTAEGPRPAAAAAPSVLSQGQPSQGGDDAARPAVRVADNDVLRRLSEGGRPEQAPGR